MLEFLHNVISFCCKWSQLLCERLLGIWWLACFYLQTKPESWVCGFLWRQWHMSPWLASLLRIWVLGAKQGPVGSGLPDLPFLVWDHHIRVEAGAPVLQWHHAQGGASVSWVGEVRQKKAPPRLCLTHPELSLSSKKPGGRKCCCPTLWGDSSLAGR